MILSRIWGVLTDKDGYSKAVANFEAVWGLSKQSFEISKFITLINFGICEDGIS